MSSVLLTVIFLSLSGSVVALVILGLRQLLRHKVSPAFFYYIWALVLLRLALPISLPFNLMGSLLENVQSAAVASAIPASPEPDNLTAGIVPDVSAASAPETAPVKPATQTTAFSASGQHWDIWAVLFWVWLAGAGIYLLFHVVPYLRFTKRLRSACAPPFKADEAIFERLRGRRRVALLQCDGLSTPMLVGLIRPRIVVPSLAYAQSGRADTLEYLLKHELVHERRRDLLFKWIAVCVSAFHWFNPMMLLIQRELSRACELSCDDAVMSGMGTQNRQQYGEVLLSYASGSRLPVGICTTTLCEGKRQLKERLAAIKGYQKRTTFTAVISVILVLLLVGCAAGLGPAQPDNTGIIMPPPTSEIEDIAGGAPIDLADNEISRAFLPYLVREAKRIHPYLATDDTEPFKLFAAVPFQDGALLLAGTAVSQDYPKLYYMVGEKVIAVNDDAEYFSSNYTVFMGKTIAFGRMVGVYTENPYVYATGVKATFAGGQQAEAQSFVPDTLPNIQGGYILVADGETWLTRLEFYRPDGTLLTDMTRTDEFGWNEDSWLYRGTEAEIFNLQHRTQFSTWDEEARAYTIILENGASAPMDAFYDDGTDISYLWRNNNILHHMRDSAPGEPLMVASYPDIITELDYPERTDGVPLPGSAEIYWFDLASEDGTRKDFGALLKPGELVTPDEHGLYLLVIREGDWWYVQVIYVE